MVMKKVLLLSFFVIASVILCAQNRLNVGLGGTVSNTSAFLDASSYATWNNSSDNGKGLVFPRVDLTTFAAIKATISGIPNSFPNRFDGMIVYNSATGTAGIGGTDVTPGFYYYANTTANLNGGTWVRITDGNDALSSASATAYYGVLNTTTPTAAEIQGLATKSLGSGAYISKFDQTLPSAGYFTLAIPVSWRNPALKIDGSDTWNVFNASTTVTINNVVYQVWQTDVELPLGQAVAVK